MVAPPTASPSYDIDEGATLDLVIDPGNANAMVAASTLPTNATFQNGVFSFAPSYSQSGLYPVTFTSTAGSGMASLSIAVRVHNVIHIVAPALAVVNEGSATAAATFSSDDPSGTVITYSADVVGVPGATFDPIARTLSFTPSWRWLDSRPALLEIDVTAQGQELDTGVQRSSTAHVVYQIKEATSFSNELVPLFLLPIGATNGLSPELESVEGHGCVTAVCHGGGTSPAGIDFHPAVIYDELVNHDVAPDGVNGSTCGGLPSTVKRVVPGDVTKSLFYMKISGTDGAGGVGPPCGVQQPTSQLFNYWTVTDQDAWNACPPAGECRTSLVCPTGDIVCKTQSRYVRKVRVWIEAGAPNN